LISRSRNAVVQIGLFAGLDGGNRLRHQFGHVAGNLVL
jgi:hypothetical protein